MIKRIKNFLKKQKVKIDYYENGQKKYESWYSLNGKKHREDGPAVQTWYENGQKWFERWYLNDKRHREDGPASQSWYKNGQKRYEYWVLNNKWHRDDGPTVQWWHKNGQKAYEDWYLNDKQYLREKWIERLKKIDSPHYDKQKFLYDAEKYNL